MSKRNRTTWVASDPHLGHPNCATKYRPFSSIDEHDSLIINNWNSLVAPTDIAWLLGDVAWTEEGLLKLRDLHGHKRLILGNHDKFDMVKYLLIFDKVKASLNYKTTLLFTHIPVHPGSLGDRINVHGHLHGIGNKIDDARYINVNIEHTNYFPTDVSTLLPTDEVRHEP
jgi:calcineurin-like phosphoesterase family protein